MRRTSGRLVRLAGTAALAILYAAPAQAGSDYLLELGGVEGETSGDKRKDHIEIQSYSWGVTRSPGGGQADALTDGLMIIRYLNVPAGGAAGGGGGGAGGMGAGKVSMQDLSVMRGPRQTTSADGTQSATGTEKFGAVGGMHRDSSSGQATGKRQHKPIRARGYYDSAAPQATGSLTIAGKFPGCVVGTRYSSLTLGGRGKRYTLQDAIITSCATASGGALPMEEVSFNYAKISF
jgi:type VI protein secretion system component Hcp